MVKPTIVGERKYLDILLTAAIVVGAVVLFYLYQHLMPFVKEEFQALDALYLLGELTCGVLSFLVSRELSNKGELSRTFSKGFLSLGISFMMYFLGELTFILNEVVFHIDPYPSYSDIFYFAFFVFAFYHFHINLNFFTVSKIKTYKITAATTAFFTVTYVAVNYLSGLEANFDFWYGFINIIGSGLILGLGLSALFVFKNSLLGRIWALLVVGILLKTIGDFWYTYLEIFDQYTALHPVNIFWIAAWLVIGISLVRQYRLENPF